MSKIIPFGDRILVKRRTIGEKLGSGLILASDETKDRETDLADVIEVPDLSFCDKELIDNAEAIIKGQTEEAKKGNAEALKALILYKEYLKIKSVQKGDTIFISKYVGTTFYDNKRQENLSIVRGDDIIGVVVKETL